jgi:hypothetical protein
MSSADDSPRDRSTMEESFNARFSMNIDSHVERGHGRTTNRSRVDGTLAVRTTARVAVLLEEGKELQLRPSIAKFGGLILNTPTGPKRAISGGLRIIPTVLLQGEKPWEKGYNQVQKITSLPYFLACNQ